MILQNKDDAWKRRFFIVIGFIILSFVLVGTVGLTSTDLDTICSTDNMSLIRLATVWQCWNITNLTTPNVTVYNYSNNYSYVSGVINITSNDSNILLNASNGSVRIGFNSSAYYTISQDAAQDNTTFWQNINNINNLSAYYNISQDEVSDLLRNNYTKLNYMSFYSTDFCGLLTTSGTPWYTTAMSGTTAVGTGSPYHPCIESFSSSTTANSGHAVNIGTAQLLLAGGEQTEFIFFKSSRAGLNLSILRIGFLDQVSTTAIADGCYIEVNNKTLGGVCSNNSVNQWTPTNFSFTEDRYYRGKITINTTSYAWFELYNSTTSLGAGNTELVWNGSVQWRIPFQLGRETGHGFLTYVVGGGAAAAILYMDYMDLEIQRTLNR